ncbi:MAG TPA: hypothetical protein VK698_35125 [Kofleriaceae bacterium]|nr:hypothetical protein [Kofleriaceae bacterium]
MRAESKLAFPPGAWLAASLAASVAAALTGCAKNVAQDGHSGKDYRNKGARTIKLDEDGVGQSRKDVVTYPGGDRVDWKMFELGAPPPEPGKEPKPGEAPPPPITTGTLKVQLRWAPPRPELDLAFDVYDQYMHRIARAKPTPGTGKRMKKVTIKDAGPGKYYVQVYAPTRGDAGTYRVKVEFKAGAEVVAVADTPGDVPDPPTLPAIPEAAEATPETQPATQPTTPTVEQPPAAQPVRARVSKYEVSGGGTLVITIDKGKNAGVEAGWKGQILGGSGQPVRGGDFTVSKVTGGEAQGKVSLSVDQIKTNNKVLLTPP